MNVTERVRRRQSSQINSRLVAPGMWNTIEGCVGDRPGWGFAIQSMIRTPTKKNPRPPPMRPYNATRLWRNLRRASDRFSQALKRTICRLIAAP